MKREERDKCVAFRGGEFEAGRLVAHEPEAGIFILVETAGLAKHGSLRTGDAPNYI
jgi:hypothetical protein